MSNFQQKVIDLIRLFMIREVAEKVDEKKEQKVDGGSGAKQKSRGLDFIWSVVPVGGPGLDGAPGDRFCSGKRLESKEKITRCDF